MSVQSSPPPAATAARTASAAVARRFLALHHLLAPPRALPATPEAVLAVVDRIGSLQFDPLEVAGRNHDLVLQARISGYRRELADDLLYRRRLLFEAVNKALNVLPTRELPWYRVTWDRAQDGRSPEVLRDNAELVDMILARISDGGPLPSNGLGRTEAIAWHWGPTSAVRAVLEALYSVGRLGLARREGNRRYFDLVERLFPEDLLAMRVPPREQQLHRLLSRYRGHGLLGATGRYEVWQGLDGPASRADLRAELVARGELVPLSVEGMPGERFVIADELPLLGQAEREIANEASGQPVRPGESAPGVSFLAPLDPLLWDRDAIASLYGFDYVWEVYTPRVKRRWGYYVLPILFGDRLVGRIEPRIDRRGRAVRILGLGWEDGFDPLAADGLVPALASALRDYLVFAGAERLVLPAERRHAALRRALRRSVSIEVAQPA